jgi:hypothetical protein
MPHKHFALIERMPMTLLKGLHPTEATVKLSHSEKLQLFKKFKFSCKGAPPMDMRGWSDEETIAYIDKYGKWLPNIVDVILEHSAMQNRGLD